MNLLDRLDPGVPALMLAASTAAVVAVVAIGAEALARLLARRGAAMRHDVYLVALTIVLASPLLALAVVRSGLTLVAPPGERPAPVAMDYGPPMVEPPALARDITEPDSKPRPTPIVAAEPTEPPSPRREAGAPRFTWAAVRGGLTAGWTIGALVMALRLVRGLIAMAGLRRRAWPVDGAEIAGVIGGVREALGMRALPPIVEVDSGLAGPVTAGVFRPSVVLPVGLADRLGAESLRDVLVHEVAHAVRRDGIVGLLQRVAAMAFWPHPLVHRLNRRLSRAREEACDDIVLGVGDPCRYARTLLQLAEGIGPGGGVGVVGLFEAQWRLEDRVARVLDPRRSTMTRSNRWWTLSAAALLVTSAVAVAAARPSPSPQEPARALVEAKPAQGADVGEGMVFRGKVVDESGKPVAGAMVELYGRNLGSVEPTRDDRVQTGPVRTGPDGGFVLRTDRILWSVVVLRATAEGGERSGVAGTRVEDNAPVEPIRVVLRPSRPLTVRVADAAGKPVAGAAVEVGAGVSGASVGGLVDPGVTDDRGVARFRVPAETMVRGVLALKDGVGVDGLSKGAVIPAPEISLTLRGTRTITFRALDSGGRPVPGVTFHLDGITPKGQLSGFSGAFRITEVTTDASGIARWRWYPEECQGVVKVVAMEDLIEDAWPRLSSFSEGDVTLNVRFRRRARLSGRVVNADGSPAPRVMVTAKGPGALGNGPPIRTWSGEDGSYTMRVRPDQAYQIAVTSPGLAAAPVSDIPIGEGERHDGLDLRLIQGTWLHGQVTFGAGVGRYVQVDLLGEECLIGPWWGYEAKDRLRLQIPVKLDAQGRYEVRLGPGDYQVIASDHRERPTIRVDGEGEFVLNFLGDTIPPPKVLTGVVVESTPGGGERPAKARIVSRFEEPIMFLASTDEAGRFTVRRTDQDIGLYAYGEGERMVAAVKVAKGVDEVRIVLGPAATASGRVVDASGRPFVGEGPSLVMSGGPGDLPKVGGIPSPSRFERGGRYAFNTGLVPGAEYKVFFILDRDTGARDVLRIKTFRVSGPGPVDLGEFVVPAAKP